VIYQKSDSKSSSLDKMRVQAKKRVKDMFTMDVFADQLDSILKEIK